MYYSKKSDFLIYLFLLTTLTCFIAYYLFKIQTNFGPVWDTCDFLISALEFADKGVGYADLTRPPIMPFLTSIFFRLGYISENVIFAIDGLLFVFGVIGLYLLFNLCFNPLKSFLGCLLYSTFPIMLLNISIGLSDIASVSFSIYAIYFTILAFKNNSKFFYLAFPFAIISFLTRYPGALIIFPILFYVFVNRNRLSNPKNLILGMITGFLVMTPFLVWSYVKLGSPIYPFMSSFNATSVISANELFYYNTDVLYFIKKLPFLVGNVSIILILFIITGFLFYCIKSKFWLKLDMKNFKKRYSKLSIWKLGLFTISFSFFIITFGNIYFMFSEVIFLVICLLFYELIKNSKYNNLDMNLLFVSWFMSFFIFHSVFVIKDLRYFGTMTPALSYFLILGLNSISNNFKLNFKGRNVIFQVISVLLIFGLLISVTGSLIDSKNDSMKESTIKDVISSSNWFKNYDPDYKNKIIYSDYYPYSTWYLRTEIKKMPILKDNKEIYAPLKNLSLDNEDFKQYENKLLNNNADYYFCVNTELNLTSYKIIYNSGNVYIYQKV